MQPAAAASRWSGSRCRLLAGSSNFSTQRAKHALRRHGIEVAGNVQHRKATEHCHKRALASPGVSSHGFQGGSLTFSTRAVYSAAGSAAPAPRFAESSKSSEKRWPVTDVATTGTIFRACNMLTVMQSAVDCTLWWRIAHTQRRKRRKKQLRSRHGWQKQRRTQQSRKYQGAAYLASRSEELVKEVELAHRGRLRQNRCPSIR